MLAKRAPASTRTNCRRRTQDFFFRLTRPHATNSETENTASLFRQGQGLCPCQKFVGVLHGRPRSHENDTVQQLRQQRAKRNQLLVCLGRARALPSRGRGTRWRRYRVTRRRECSGKKIKNSPNPLQGHGENFFFTSRGSC